MNITISFALYSWVFVYIIYNMYDRLANLYAAGDTE